MRTSSYLKTTHYQVILKANPDGTRAQEGRLFPGEVVYCARVAQNEVMKRLLWSGLLAGIGALAAVVANRAAATIWRRAFGEDPPE
jgi:hypothetical protein